MSARLPDYKDFNWPQMLDEALTLPGNLGNTYNRFYNYSFFNQLLLRIQGVNEPVNTYKRWQAMGRQVLKGSKAKAILRPIKFTITNEQGEREQVVKGFKAVNCLFGVSETEGDPLPEVQPRTWDRAKALGALAVKQVPFDHLDGNTQGYSYERNVAINPVAAYPMKTLMHELAHVVLSHTSPEGIAEYQRHRGIMEFEAEATAYLTMNELELAESMDMSESRGYIQHWLQGQTPDDKHIRRVFAATDAILRAGRE